jgi:hypothetical protein
MNQSADLGTANGACATCAEDDLVCCKEESVVETTDIAEGEVLPKMPSFQMSLMYSDLGRGMMKFVVRGKVNQSQQRMMQIGLNS